MGISIFVLLILVFLLNGKISRLNSAPPVHYAKHENTPKITISKQEVKIINEEKKSLSEISTDETVTVAPSAEKLKNLAAVAKDTNALTIKLSTVELILIRADIFAEKVNGESKFNNIFFRKTN